ncbi:hypothetical protein N5C81_24945 [Rhizobium pusense]|uniref:hypothetical protein n=1 Tax=Agrobacterium pusense TaxID=648995 RepID=UPI00244B5C93|nr:hypothetical protein [Agrobacterium pusense]MDH1270862.1 hypothetical protein [Agrobacterium pusense]
MRHVFAALTISARTIGMGKAPPPGTLVASSRRPQAVTARRMGAGRTAIALTPIAMAAKQHLRATPPAKKETSSSHHGGAPREAPSGLIGEARRNAPMPV